MTPDSIRRASAMALAGLALTLWAGPGCVSSARRLAPALAQQVVSGQGRAQVESVLGAPGTVKSLEDGRALVVYRYVVAQESARTDLLVDFPDRRVGTFRFAGELIYRKLTVLYSPAGEVERSMFSDTRTPYYEELAPSFDAVRRKWVGTEITPSLEASWRRRVTTRAELELQLGAATWKSFTPGGEELHGWISETLVGRHFPERRGQELVVTFDPNGVLLDFNLFHSGSPGPGENREGPAVLNPP